MNRIVKIICTVLFTFVMISTIVLAEEVTLQWDPNDPTPDGYKMFRREDGQLYNYASPIWIGTETLIKDSDIGRSNEKVIYYWVVRAYVGDEESGDSNEVTYTVNLLPPEVINNLEGGYNSVTNEIQLTWSQTGEEIPAYWKIYYSEISGGLYTELDTIQNTGIINITSIQTLSVNKGEMKTFYFVIVGFKSDSLYSANSNEVSIVVDRRMLTPINTLRIIISSE